MILGIICFVFLPSCQREAHEAPPAYSIDVGYTEGQGVVTVEQGGAVDLPVTVRSLVDQSIDIRIRLAVSVGQLPQFIQYEPPPEFVTLAPQANLDTHIEFGVSRDAAPGDYNIVIDGQLREPVKGRSGMQTGIRLKVVAK
jgi:hypothetical protein